MSFSTFAGNKRFACACPCDTQRPPDRARRKLIVAGTSVALGGCSSVFPSASSETMPGNDSDRRRVDLHHHLAPPAWLAEARGQGHIDPTAANWTVDRSIADMDRAGIASAVLSVANPGVYFERMDVATGRRVARESNEYAARLVADRPGRFGFFACLPLLDLEGSLREIDYAIDTLKADGVGLITSYGDRWLGDPLFTPVMAELDRRRTVVYTHPTAAKCCSSLQPGIPPVMIEYGTDTTRAIASILFNGVPRSFPDIRWIFSHGGGSMPFLIERFVRAPLLNPKLARQFPEGVAAEIERFYFDTAQIGNAAALSALTKVVPATQVVLGTDFPYRNGIDGIQSIRASGVFSTAQLAMIETGTPLKLIPRLNGSATPMR